VNLRIGIAILLVLGTGYILLKKSAEPHASAEIVRARLSDVKGMPIGAPVTLAGLKVGSIVERRVGSGYAEIDIQFDTHIDLRKDATLYKRRSSLLSGPRLEIDPGSSKEPLPTKYIERVVETSEIGDILYEISEALPAVSRKSEEGLTRAENFRARVNGPFRKQVVAFDKATEDIHKRMHNRLTKMDEGLKIGEKIEFDARASIEPKFARTEELTEFARDNLERAREWVTRSAEATRKKMEDSKIDWSPYADPIRKIDEGEGTLGTLLNSSELHDDTVELTGRARSFVRAYVNWKMRVGLRAEYSAIGREGRAYVTVKAGRTNRYFYVELLATSKGSAPETTARYDAPTGTWQRDLTIKNKLRLTAQWARRLGPVVFRYGLKESSFGAGTDLELIDNRLEISADVFEFGQADRPHLKVAATYRIFGQLYILAGMDDLLNPGVNYNIAANGAEQPQALEEIYVGRDYYLGGSLRFSDRDLASLLRIGGDALGALVPL
jgi:hypothetical protein